MSKHSKAVDQAEHIRLAAFDVDGVFTKGELIFSDKCGELKIFHSHDGLGLKLLKSAGCEVAIISSRHSEIVSRRFAELDIVEIHQNQQDKAHALSLLMNKYELNRSNIAFTGDDVVDIPAMRISGLSIAVANAHPLVKQQADWVTARPGGKGAVREVCEMILGAQGKLDATIKTYTN